MNNIFGETELKDLVRFRKVIPGYYISKDGTKIIGKRGKSISTWINSHGYPTCSITIHKNFYSDYEYQTRNDGSENHSTISLKIPLHRAVIETWKPIDDNPPKQLADTWNDVPEVWRQWVRDTALVDHIDDDRTNNHVDNLRWETPKNNEPNRKKQMMRSEIGTPEIDPAESGIWYFINNG